MIAPDSGPEEFISLPPDEEVLRLRKLPVKDLIDEFRITSYNVCYTKLLRAFFIEACTLSIHSLSDWVYGNTSHLFYMPIPFKDIITSVS